MTKSEGLSDYNVHTGQEVRKLLVTVDLYIDVFFVINMILDYLVLSITGKVMRYRAGRYRIVLGAALGAAWAVLCAAFPSIPPAVSFFMTYAVVSCLMVVTAFGVDPVHFGIIMILNLMIGLLTPPVGMVLYVLSKVSSVPFERICKATVPFIIMFYILLQFITYIPQISLALPNWMYGA